MKTNLSDQVKAVQKARSYPPKPLEVLINGPIANQYDSCLNDAGATLASLNTYLTMYKGCDTDEERSIIANEFFKILIVI